jgi:hypothetical protein
MTLTRRQTLIGAATVAAGSVLPAGAVAAPAKTYSAYWVIGARLVSVSASSQAELRRLMDEADMPLGTTFSMED